MALESISLPRVMLAVAVATVLLTHKTPAKQAAVKSAGACQTRYCNATDMFVDKPMNTLLKDQSLGVGLKVTKQLPGPGMIQAKIKSDLEREQLLSPGVNLVAHAIA